MPSSMRAAFFSVKRTVAGIVILPVQLIHGKSQSLSEALIVNDLTFPEKTDYIIYIRVIAQPQDIIIRYASLLLGGKIFVEVGQDIPCYADPGRIPRRAGGGGRIYTCRVIHEIPVKACALYLLRRHTARELVDDRADHFKVSQFFCADIADAKKHPPEKPRKSGVSGAVPG